MLLKWKIGEMWAAAVNSLALHQEKKKKWKQLVRFCQFQSHLFNLYKSQSVKMTCCGIRVFVSVFLGRRRSGELGAVREVPGSHYWPRTGLAPGTCAASDWVLLYKLKQTDGSRLVYLTAEWHQTFLCVCAWLTCSVACVGGRFSRHLLQATQKLGWRGRLSRRAPALNDVTHHRARAIKQNLSIVQILAQSLEQTRCIIGVMKTWITVTQYLSKHQVITIFLDNDPVFLLWKRSSSLHRNCPRDRHDVSSGGESQGTLFQNNGKWSSGRAKDIGFSFTSGVRLLVAVSC